MKYIFEFEQEKAIEIGLDMEDLLILKWIKMFTTEMKSIEMDGNIYYWIKYEKLLNDLPILRFKSKKSLFRKFDGLVQKGILIHQTVRVGGTYSYYGFGENYSKLLSEEKEPEESEKELADNFEKIWNKYPRKEGKNTAFKHYKNWLKGKKYAGKTVKLENKQMWFAVAIYAHKVKTEQTEKQFIKMGSTFFNEAIMEYVEMYNKQPEYWEKSYL